MIKKVKGIKFGFFKNVWEIYLLRLEMENWQKRKFFIRKFLIVLKNPVEGAYLYCNYREEDFATSGTWIFSIGLFRISPWEVQS